MKKKKIEGLTILGGRGIPVPGSPADAPLECFDNSHPDRDYEITFDCPEFTSLCPVTGQPDFGSIRITYVPDRRCIESKSLKLHLHSFRNHNSFHEEVVNMIRDAIVAAAAPRSLEVEGSFRPRGGISIKVKASYVKKGEHR